MSAPRVFVDTNVVVYAYDATAGARHETARAVLLDLWRSGAGLVSTQVLQELYVTLTRKIPRPVEPALAREIVEDMATWDVVVNDAGTILQAIEIAAREKLSFWDALVVAAAARGGAGLLLSDDLSDGRTIEGVTVRDPFRAAPG